jgi:hypothetical protein
MLLNSTLASGLGRPDLAYMAQSQAAVSTLTPPTAGWMSSGSEASIGGFDMSDRGPTVALFALTAALVVYVFWIRKHLA